VRSTYFERGGLRWGEIHWNSSGAAWPLAKLYANSESIHLSYTFFGFLEEEFIFEKNEILRIKGARNIPLPFIKGIIIEHNSKDKPSFVLFWSFSYSRLITRLKSFGFEIDESERKWMM